MEKEPQTDSEPTYVSISDVAGRLGMQSQYVSYYLGGYGGKPDLSEGIRFHRGLASYHEISFHPDDVEEFIKRVKNVRQGY